jgi:hypothetical protein
MDKLHEEKLRAEFERQIREDLLFDDEELEWQPERNCYSIYGVHLAWWGYRASRVNSPVTPDGWVACSESMPGKYKEVVLWCPETKEQFIGFYDGREYVYAQGPDGVQIVLILSDISHWQPLPAAPKPEK